MHLQAQHSVTLHSESDIVSGLNQIRSRAALPMSYTYLVSLFQQVDISF